LVAYTAAELRHLMVGLSDTPGRRTPVVVMESSVVDLAATEQPRTPALDWKEFFGE